MNCFGKQQIKIEPDEIVDFYCQARLNESARAPTPFEIIPFSPPSDLLSVPQWLIPVDCDVAVKKEKVDTKEVLKPVAFPFSAHPTKVSPRDPRLKKLLDNSSLPSTSATTPPRSNQSTGVFIGASHLQHPWQLLNPIKPISDSKKVTEDAQTQTTNNTGTLHLELSEAKLRNLSKSQKEILIKFKKEFDIGDSFGTNDMLERSVHRKANRFKAHNKESSSKKRDRSPSPKRSRTFEDWW